MAAFWTNFSGKEGIMDTYLMYCTIPSTSIQPKATSKKYSEHDDTAMQAPVRPVWLSPMRNVM